jgi:hypothetical protein
MENFFTNMQQTNWTSGTTAGEKKERQTDRAEMAISLLKVVDATPGQEPLPLTLYSIPLNTVTQGQRKFQINSLPILENIFLSNK